MKKINKLLIPLLFLNSFNLNAAISYNKTGSGLPVIGEISFAIANSYYSSCVLKIHSKTFGSMAMDGGAYGITPTQKEFQKYEDKLLKAIEETNQDKVNNITSIFSSLRTHLLKTKTFNAQQNAQIEAKQRELKMEYKASLEKEIEKAKSTSFGDTAKGKAPAEGSFTYDLMRNLCKKNKMYEATQGENARKTNLAAVAKKSKKNVNQRQNVASVVSETIKKQERHYDLFCSEEEKNGGLCENVSQLANADIMADNFLLPAGDGSNTSSYSTNYTYNKMEALAADSFLNNIVGIMPVNPPTPAEKNNPNNLKFVALYNQLISSLNLSSYIFENSYQNRLPKNQTGVRLSNYDTLNYMIEDMNSIKSKAIEGQSDGNGFEMTYQSVLALKTKLEMEKLVQKERIKLIEATLLGLMENSSENLINMEKLK